MPPTCRRLFKGSVARRYPPGFDDYGWLRAPWTVTEAEMAASANTLVELQTCPKSLRLASRRLSSAALRVDEDDAVLDLCIALEAALGDQQRSEMTYKLGVRAAAVLGLEDPQQETPTTILQRVKRLYDWRSAIVHGADAAKARLKFAGEDVQMGGLEIATSLVRRVLRQLVQHPALRKAHAIDSGLLLRQRRHEDGTCQ
jgi:hypothetical protein